MQLIPGFKIKIKFNVIMKLVINLLLLIRGVCSKFSNSFLFIYFSLCLIYHSMQWKYI